MVPACSFAIFGDPVEFVNKECQCRVDYPCDPVDDAAATRTTLFEFHALDYTSSVDAFSQLGIIPADGMEFEIVSSDRFGIEEALLRVTPSAKGGCNDLYVEIDTSEALASGTDTDVTYEVTATVGIDSDLAAAEAAGAEFVTEHKLFGGIATRPCAYACNWLHTKSTVSADSHFVWRGRVV